MSTPIPVPPAAAAAARPSALTPPAGRSPLPAPRSQLPRCLRRCLSLRGTALLLVTAAAAAAAVGLTGLTARAGTWTPLAQSAPGTVDLMLLLSDGTVMAADGGNSWFRLTPDLHGSYINGTWSTLASMNDSRLYYSSQVLRDGRVFVAGGEYGSGKGTAEVYDPVTDTWTYAPVSGQGFSDSISKILPNGNVLIAPVVPSQPGLTVIYDPVANAWQAGPTLFRGTYQDEASWVKLPDDSILTIDPFGVNSERYIPSLNRWVNDANVPVALYDTVGSEIGAGMMLADGRAFFFGSTGHTAYYTPSGTTNAGTWVAGPDIPNSQGTPDAPAANLINGKILCAVCPVPYPGNSFPSPTMLYEFDPVAQTFTSVSTVNGPNLSGESEFRIFLDLPDGTVLYSGFSSQLSVYQTTGAPLAAGRPGITNITQNADGTYHLTGTLLNGIWEGAVYGDDAQMNSNYPLIRLTDGAGNIRYARTFNWSRTSIHTGNQLVTTEFSLPPGLPAGPGSLVVVANGIASATVPFTAPALQLTPLTGISAVGKPGGPFTPASWSYVLTNNGAAAVAWSAAASAPWLKVAPASGTLLPGGPAVTVTASLNNSAAAALAAGSYPATLTITNAGSGQSLARAANLTVQATNSAAAYVAAVQALNPAGYWRLNELTQPSGGGTATNLGSLGNSLDGAYAGVPGWVGGALVGSSDGAALLSGGYVSVPFTSDLSLAGPFTVEAWVKPATALTSGNFGCALACGEFASPRSGWLIYQSATGWDLRMYNQNGTTFSLSLETGGTPVPGVWYHLAAVYDGNNAYMYVNGAGVSGTPAGFVPNVDGPLTLGVRSDLAFAFGGSLDEVAVYGTALPAATILGHYQNGTNRSPATPYPQLVQASQPLCYYRLDQPAPLPAAINLGRVGAAANGLYEPGAQPGAAGPPYPVFGPTNYGCRLNGLAGFVDVPGAVVNFTTPLTVMAWVKLNAANGNLQTVLGHGAASYHLDVDPNGYPGFADGQPVATEIFGPARVDDGQWHHLAGVYDGAHSEFLYVDGALAASTTAATTAVAGNFNDLWLGGSPEAGSSGIFSGTLAEAVVFTNALSAALVRQLFDAATTSPPIFQTTRAAGGVLNLAWSTVPLRTYQLQTTTNLNLSAWVNQGAPLLATNSTLSITVPLAPATPRQFYRATQVP